MKKFNFLHIFNLVLMIGLMISCSKGSSDSSGNLMYNPTGKSGSTARIVVVGNYIYAVDNNTLKSIDISNPENPIYIKSQTIVNGIETIFNYKNYLFIGSNSGMFIYGLTNPASPNLLNSISHITACDPVIANDSLAFVTLRNTQVCHTELDVRLIKVINIQDISNSFEIMDYTTSSDPFGLDMNDDYLFVCHGTAGFAVYDKNKLLHGQNPLVNSVAGISAYDAILYNNILFIVGESGLYQYDYSDINSIKLISSIIAGS